MIRELKGLHGRALLSECGVDTVQHTYQKTFVSK